MPFDISGIGPGKPVLGRHISDLYAGLTGGLTDQPISLAAGLSVLGTLTVNGVPLVVITQAQWDALLARVTALEARPQTDPALRTYVQTIMSVLDPGAPPPP